MPAKGYSYSRDTVIDKELFDSFLIQYPEYKDQLDYNTFKDVILESNKNIAAIIINEDNGFKLPENLGYIAVTRYKSKKKAIDWESTHKYKKRIYHNNLHTFGFSFKIRWYKAGIAKFRNNRIYKFDSCRTLSRAVAKMAKEGRMYLEWKMADFWDASKLERSFRKQFKVAE